MNGSAHRQRPLDMHSCRVCYIVNTTMRRVHCIRMDLGSAKVKELKNKMKRKINEKSERVNDRGGGGGKRWRVEREKWKLS